MPARSVKKSASSSARTVSAKKAAKSAGKPSAKKSVAKQAVAKQAVRKNAVAKNAVGRKAVAKKAVARQAETRRSKASAPKPTTKGAAASGGAIQLLEAMTGKASPAKAAEGDAPVFAYIATLPQPQREIAERIDALAARTLPKLQRAVKWGMAYYGVGDGWCFSSGAFARHVKVMFINGDTLAPVPPVTPIGMGKATRGVELERIEDIDEQQLAAWMRAITARPGVGGKRR